MDAETPAAIAGKLTPAQRRALMWLPGDGKWKLRMHVDFTKPPGPSLLGKLVVRSLADWKNSRDGHVWRVSERGLAVRAELEKAP